VESKVENRGESRSKSRGSEIERKIRTCGGWIRGERGEGNRENKWKSEGDTQGGR
jgi:hypothetical protein